MAELTAHGSTAEDERGGRERGEIDGLAESEIARLLQPRHVRRSLRRAGGYEEALGRVGPPFGLDFGGGDEARPFANHGHASVTVGLFAQSRARAGDDVILPGFHAAVVDGDRPRSDPEAAGAG